MITKDNIKEIFDRIYKNTSLPSKEKPIYWNKGGYTFKNDGDNLYILMEDGTFEIINLPNDRESI